MEVMTDIQYFMLDENEHLMFFNQHPPPSRNPANAHESVYILVLNFNSPGYLLRFLHQSYLEMQSYFRVNRSLV